MTAVSFRSIVTLAMATGLAITVLAQVQKPTLRIVWPPADSIVSGPTQIEATIEPPAAVNSVTFTVNGKLLCTVERVPYRCSWDPGNVVRGHHVRVVATLTDGTSGSSTTCARRSSDTSRSLGSMPCSCRSS